jgi:hypothetical protein
MFPVVFRVITLGCPIGVGLNGKALKSPSVPDKALIKKIK